MRLKPIWQSVGVSVLVFLSTLAAQEVPNVRPGKGMSLVPGDFAEYTNTQFAGEKNVGQSSTIMVAIGKTDKDFERVLVINVKEGKPVSRRFVDYDLSNAKGERGEMLGTGQESLLIKGRKYECTWEKRRDGEVVATFWKCPDLPFERYAKVEMAAPDGQKMVTELILHGPDISDKVGNQEFLKRLKEFNTLLGE